ncbi:MAG: hypothetical protein M3Q34_04330 [bacterium]|nr:hypothetical protein [bacterium]
MNTQSNTTEKQSVEKAYISHVLRYVGVGLISGSIVHMGTLGGESTRYIILIIMGVVAFITGTLLEKRESESSLTSFIVVSVIMSIGVGMVSGGTQHYLDGPTYAAFLIPIGMAIGYFAFLFRDYKSEINTKRILVMSVIAIGLITVLYFIAKRLPVQEDHHAIENLIESNNSSELIEERVHIDGDGHAN